MRIKNKILPFMMAAVLSLSAGFTAFADETKKADAHVTDKTMITDDTDAPTLSFDGTEWKDHLETVDAAGVSFKLKNDNKNAYQGQCLSISVTSEGDVADDTLAYNWECLNSKGEPLFEAEPDENKKYTCMGVLLKAEKFGLDSFNGATLGFKYRISEQAKGLLMANSFFAAPVDAEGNYIPDAKVTKFTINTTDSNNVTMFSIGVLPVAEVSEENNIPAAGIMIMLPIHSAANETPVLSLDNLVISLKSGAQVKNLDRYNQNASTKEGKLEIQEKVVNNTVKDTGDGQTTKSKIKSIVSIAGLIVLGVAVAAAIVFAIIKSKRRFY